ncbi:germinal-center associated nuclear protein isoform X2 [Octopus sinensis]|uniref:Germinal-center associated nuclear protein n=1 Tax=Octopus sinensis TaxID=2607531 RepID=A0A7E6FQQ2_9MOLL|nr:germinal-center associated nuclear protein isoform X2 [Octopus sinensis]
MFQAPNPRQSPQNQLPSFGQIVNTSLSPPSQQRPFGSGGIAAGFGSPSAFGSSGNSNVASFGSTAAFGSSTNAAGFGSTAAFGSSSSNTAGFGNTPAFGSSGTNTASFGNTAAFGNSSSHTNVAGFGSTAAFGSSSTNAAGFGSTAAFGSNSTNAAGFGSTAAFGSSSTNAAGFGSTTAFGGSSTNAAGFGSTAAFGSSGSGNQKTASFSTNTFPSSSTSSSPDQFQSRPSTFTPPASLPKPTPPQSNTSSFTTSPKSQNVTSSGGHGGTDAISFARVAADHPPTGIFSVKSEKNPFGGVGAFSGNGNNNNSSAISITATTSSSVFGVGQNPFGRSSFPPAFSATKAEPQVLKVKNSNPFLNAPTDNVFSRSQSGSDASDNPPTGTLPMTAFGAFVSNNNSSMTALPSSGFGTGKSKTVLSTATTASSTFTSPVTLSTSPLLPSPSSFPGPLTQQTGPSATFTKNVFGSRGDMSSSSGPVLAKSSTGSFLPLSKNNSIGGGGSSSSSSSSSIHSSERNVFKGDAKPMPSAFARKSIAKVFGGVPLSESKRSSTSVSASSDPNTGSVGLFGKSHESHSSFSKTKASSSSTISKYSTEVSAAPSLRKTGLFGKPERTGSRAEEKTLSVSAAANTTARTSLSPSTSKLRNDGPSHRSSSYSYMDEDECDDRVLSVAQRAVSSSRMEMDKMSKVPVASRFYSKTMDSTGRLAGSRKRFSITDDGRHRKVPKSRSEYDLMRSSNRSKMSRSAMRQRQFSEELESHPVLVCKNIPPKFNQVPFLRNHFSKFGAVQRVTRNLAKHGANIHFKDHKSAAHAKMKGLKLAPGIHIQIFWQSNPHKQSLTLDVDLDTIPPDESERQGHMPLPSSRRSINPPPPPPTSGRRDRQQQPSWMSDEVEEELRLMAGTSDISGDFVQTLVRRKEAEAPFVPMTKRATTTSTTGKIVSTSSPLPLSRKSDSPSRRHQSSHDYHQEKQQEHRRKVQKQPSPTLSGVSSQALTPASVLGSTTTTHRKRKLHPQPPSSSSPSMTSQSAFADTKKSIVGPAVPSTVRSYSSVVAGHRTTASATTTTTATAMATSLFRKSEHSSMIFGGFQGDTDVQKANVTISASRVQLLDQRDRSIRNGLKKKSNLATAKALIGSCPDMCPEKERYDREAKRRLHMFEMIPATKMMAYPQVDHARAVKEYSRSSADQEEPLIHELRPGPVLVRTMNYLLSEIANRGQDGLWAEWFDFLWDRSRGIRKDITQQMMCNRDAVALIEKCVRFHVFASERLCEEDISVFSPKINDENLTKCLQSLKYLYADLDKKKKIRFDTEAEFRSYMVLMNLNQGDILREVQTLRPEVRTSPEIHFALQVYSALNSNNYIKFFKLARTATFLSSCIIHRYFMQVRSKALRILRKALTFGAKPVPYPLSELVRTLCFESTSEAGSFCRHYGFTVEGSEVLLDRSSFIEPEVAPCLVRAVNFIESKCTQPIGEVINGGPLEPVKLPNPINSFDEDGNLKQEALSKEVLQTWKDSVTMEAETSEGPDTSPQLPSETAKPAAPCDMQLAVASEETLWQGSELVTSNAEVSFDSAVTTVQQQLQEQHQQKTAKSTAILLIKEIAKDLFLEVIATFAREISQEFYQKSEQLGDVASDVQRSISDDVVNREMRVIAQEVHTESTANGAAMHAAGADFQFEKRQEQLEEDDEEERLRRLLQAKTEELASLSQEDGGEVREIEEEEEFDEAKLLKDDEEEEEEEGQQAEVEEEEKQERQEQIAEILSMQKKIDRPFMKQRELEERSQKEVENERKKEEEEEKYKKAMAERMHERERAMRARAIAEHKAKKRQEEEKTVALLKAKQEAEEKEMRERLRAKKAAAEKEAEEEQKRVAAEEEQRRKSLAEEVTEQMLEELVLTEVHSVVSQQMSDIEKELHDRLVKECCQRATEEIMNEVVSELCMTEGHAFYRNDIELRLETLRKAEYCVRLYKMNKILECWKQRQLQRQHERDMTMFPSWPSLAPLDKQLKTLCGKEHEGVVGDTLVMGISRIAHLSMETPVAINRRDDYLPLALTLCHMRRHLIQQKAWYPLDLAATVGPSLLSSSSYDTQICSGQNSGSLYWKLLMSLPELDEQQTDNATMYSLELSDWLKAKLSKGAKPQPDVDNMSILSLYKCHLEGSSIGRQQRDTMLHFCLREVTGSLTPDLIQHIESKRLFCGTSGLLFVLPLLSKDDDKEKYWLDAQIRLSTLLQAKPQQPSLPVAVLVPHDETEPGSPPSLEQLLLKLDLSCLINQELVSSIELFTLPFRCQEESGFDVETVAVETMLSNCLRWLATHLPSQPNLDKKYLKDFLEDFLASQFYGPLLYNRGLRSAEGYLQQPPDVIIDFYNSILRHLIDCVTDSLLTSYSWPITEFVDATAQRSHDNDLPPIHWNSPEHLLFVRDTLRSLTLPPFAFGDDTSEKWSQAEQDVWSYIRSVTLERSGKSAVDLVSRVRHHIHQVEKQFDEVCRLKYGVSNCTPTYVNMPWVDIILDCVNHCLTTVSCLDPKSTDTVRATELCVLYEKEKLHSYQPPQSWSEAAIVEKNMRESCNLESTFYRSIDIRNKELRETLSASKSLHQDKPSSWDSTHDDHHQLAETVKASIGAERTKSDGFESFLMQSVVGGDLQYEDDTWQEERDGYSEFYPRGVSSAGIDEGKEVEEWKILKRKDTFDCNVELGCGSVEPHASKVKLSLSPISYPGDFSVPEVRDKLSLEDRLLILRDQIDYNKRTDTIMECLLQSFLIDDSLDHDNDELFTEDCG